MLRLFLSEVTAWMRRRMRRQKISGVKKTGEVMVVEVEGFNVHANTRIAANDRRGLEALCRYIARPPLSDERLDERPDGNLTLRLKRPGLTAPRTCCYPRARS